MGGWLGKTVLMGLTFTVFYHLCNGIRHLCWDMGYFFTIENAYRAGYIVIFASIVLTLLSWHLACPYMSGGK